MAMIGRMIERLFVSVRADMSDLSKDLSQGVNLTRQATNHMAGAWGKVSNQVDQLTRDLAQGRITQGHYTSQMNKLASSMKGVAGSYREAQKEVWGFSRASAMASRTTAIAMDTKPVAAFTRSVGQSRMQMMNLGYQINDIGMTLATGMNPMTVLIQQGSQILQIYAGQGGINMALRDMGRILSGIARKAWPLAAIAAGLALTQREINKTSDVAVSFMDTTKAVFQVIGRRIYNLIEGPLADLRSAFNVSFDFVGKWFSKIMNWAIGANIAVARSIDAVISLLPPLWHDTWTAIKNGAITAITFIINLFKVHLPKWGSWGANKLIQALVAGYRAISVVWKMFPSLMRDAIGGAVNWVVGGVEKLVNVSVAGINKLMSGLQAIMDFVGADKALELFGFEGTLPTLGDANLSKWKMTVGDSLGKTAGAIASEVGRTFNETFIDEINNPEFRGLDKFKGVYRGAFGELGRRISDIVDRSMNTDFMGDFFKEVKDQAIVNALKRIEEGLDDVGGAAKKVKEEIDELMETLDEQLTKAADNLAQVFGNAFEQLASTGKLTFRSFINDLNQLVIKSTSELLQQELSNMFKTLTLSQGGLGSLFSNLFSGLFGGGGAGFGIGARARGGVEMPWRSFVAGEEGAELINQDGPAGARRVKTAGQTRHMMQQEGGGGPNITMIVQTPDVESFRQSQSQLASRMGMFIARGQRNQ